MLEGTERVPCSDGGVNGPSLRSAPRMARQAARASGVGPHALSAVERSGTSGGVVAVNGWVGAATSPGTLLAGTARSSTGNSGRPLVRSNTNIIPDLVVWTTAGIRAPFCVTAVSAGGEALS